MVGALAAAELPRTLGAQAIVGGLTWERRVIDPIPGARRLDELTGASPLNDCVAWCSAQTHGPDGVLFAETHMARYLGERTVLVDPNVGPARVAAGLADACAQLSCDALLLVDVGGDVLAHGEEPGLASPLADSILLSAARHLPSELTVAAAVFGAGCDGELTPAEVSERLAEVAAHGGMLGAWGLDVPAIERLEAAVEQVPTEASAMALRCARGATGTATIRGGRRTVPLTPLGGLTFYLDPLVAIDSAARLADAVADAPDLATANAILHRLGVRSELDYEQEMRASG